MEKRVSTIRKEIKKQTEKRSLFWVHNDERNIHWDTRGWGDTEPGTIAELKRQLKGVNGNVKCRVKFYSPKKSRQKRKEIKRERAEQERWAKEFEESFRVGQKIANNLTVNTYISVVDKKRNLLKHIVNGRVSSYYKISDKRVAELEKGEV